jgi:hypothetical protein
VVIIAGTDKQDFRARVTGPWPLGQALDETLPGFFGGPQTQFRAQVQQVQARGPTAGQPPGNRCLAGEAVVKVKNIQGKLHP